MTKDEILTKAWEAGLLYKKDNEWIFDPSANPVACTVWFAEEVIFSEREACAKVCEGGVDTEHPTVKGHIMKDFGKSRLLAAAIRARSNT